LDYWPWKYHLYYSRGGEIGSVVNFGKSSWLDELRGKDGINFHRDLLEIVVLLLSIAKQIQNMLFEISMLGVERKNHIVE
jgi:hypothetical protein